MSIGGKGLESKWCWGLIIEAVNPRWLHPTSILDIWIQSFEHLHMLWMGVITYTCAGWGWGPKFENFGEGDQMQMMLWWCHKSKWLKLPAPADCILHPCLMYKVFEPLHMLSAYDTSVKRWGQSLEYVGGIWYPYGCKPLLPPAMQIASQIYIGCMKYLAPLNAVSNKQIGASLRTVPPVKVDQILILHDCSMMQKIGRVKDKYLNY